MDFKAFISGCAGLVLNEAERRFFAETRPCGLILFARNCSTPEQIKALIASFKDAVGSDEVLVLIDQEGGRVQRLRPPHWRAMPPARCYGRLYEIDRGAGQAGRVCRRAADRAGIPRRSTSMSIARPVLDVPEKGAHEIIGDRAFSTDPEVVIALGRAVMDGCLAGGVLPVIKHVPGHGRAKADSHLALPRIDVAEADLDAIDFRPFRALHDAPLAMTAHVLLPIYDDRRPASISPVIMGEVIRNRLGLTGLVMSDDLGMKALGGPFSERARGVIEAGCDVALHCGGNLAEMQQVAGAVPPLEGIAAERFARARDCLHEPQAFDVDEALALVTEAAGTQVAALGADPTVQA